MSLEIDLAACLKTIDGGCFELIAPQNINEPYSIYQVISDSNLECLAGATTDNTLRTQVDVYCNDTAQRKAIVADIKSRLLMCGKFNCIIEQSFSRVTSDGKSKMSTLDFTLTNY